MATGMGEIVKSARSELNVLTGLEVSSTIEVENQDGEWRVVLEVVEKHSIPEGMDILASYETRLDEDGGMLEFRRTGMRRRIDTDWTPE
ncbi:MAG: gas vesicle protein [Deltaproteobacteria bacterium]|nr:gas vesicle protein [Deltaproteobacteria bacterium]